jgi:Ca-activated chloride channel family protein
VRVSLYRPFGLLVLLVVPAAGGLLWRWLRGRPAPYAVRFTSVEVLAGVAVGDRRWRRFLPVGLFVCALVSACVAVARPYLRVLVGFERQTVMLVVDVSGSMRATDIRPSRIGAAQQAARAFVARLPRPVRVGVIAFSFEPELLVPPTTDRRLVGEAIGSLTPNGSTAIGDALAAAIQVGERATAAGPGTSMVSRSVGASRGPVSIVLLSDGSNNSGQLQPLQAARLARAAGAPVYTIALGSPSGAWMLADAGLQRIAPPDLRTLHAIATATGGRFTNAINASTLRRAYSQLGRQLGWKPAHEEISSLFLGAAAVFLVGASILGNLRSPRLP